MRTMQMALDDELVDAVDKVVKKLKTTRSAFTHQALHNAITKANIKQMEGKHREGHGVLPTNWLFINTRLYPNYDNKIHNKHIHSGSKKILLLTSHYDKENHRTLSILSSIFLEIPRAHKKQISALRAYGDHQR